jgi:glycosyltransferase involved in cell wall biosynthesis
LAVASDLRDRGFRRLEIWRRGVDQSVFSPRFRSETLRQRLGVGENAVLIGYVGRLAKEKRIDVLLDAIRLALPHLDDAQFAIVGDGPEREAYCARAPRAVRFLGRLEGSSLSAFYASCDVLVFPSDTDTFGNVLLEAMASGLAIIAADTPVTREVLANGQAGMFYPARDSAALAARLTALASAPSVRHHLARIALSAASRCSWDEVFDSLLESYSLVSGSHRPSTWARA